MAVQAKQSPVGPQNGSDLFYKALATVVVALLIVVGLIFVPWDKVPLFKNSSMDFFWMLGLLTLLSLSLVFVYFFRQKDTDSIERARTLATFAIVLVGILVLWGIFYTAMLYIREPLDQARLRVGFFERRGLTAEEISDRIHELRVMAQTERGDRIVDVATLAGLIIAPLSTLIGFVAGQAAGSSGQELASSRANEVASVATNAAQQAQREVVRMAGRMTPQQFAALEAVEPMQQSPKDLARKVRKMTPQEFADWQADNAAQLPQIAWAEKARAMTPAEFAAWEAAN